MDIRTAADLDRHGLRDIRWLHPTLRERAARVQLALMEKYVGDGAAVRRQWLDVHAAFVNPDRTLRWGELQKETLPGKQLVVLSTASHMKWRRRTATLSTASFVDEAQSLACVPLADPVLELLLHEGIHGVVEAGMRCGQLNQEISDRISKITGEWWQPMNPHLSPRLQRLAMAGLSQYSGTDSQEFLAECLVEWNMYGPRANELARAVGTSFDRYLARGSAGATRAGVIQSEPANWFTQGTLGQSRLMIDIPEWQATYDEFAQGNAETVEFIPLNLTGHVNVQLPGYSPFPPVNAEYGVLSPGVETGERTAAIRRLKAKGVRLLPPNGYLAKLSAYLPGSSAIEYDTDPIAPAYDAAAVLAERDTRYMGAKQELGLEL